MARLLLKLLHLAGFGAVEQVMRHRSFRIYLFGHIPNVIGVWVVRVAIGWLGWQLTGSAFWLGALAAADSMPALVLGPFGGALADRLDRRQISIVTQAALCIIAVFLAVLTVSGLMTIWILFALALGRGITAAFWQPVRLAMMPNLVPREEIPTAIALNSSTFHSAQFIGPAVATGLLTLGGPSLAFAFNVIAAGAMVAVLMAIEVPSTAVAKHKRGSVYAEIVAGMRYGFTHAGIGPMLLLLLMLGLGIRPLTELLPGFADLVFGLDVGGYSLMVSSVGLGAMSGAIWMLRQGNRGGITAIALRSGLLGGGAALLFALTNWLPLAIVCLAVLGFSMTSGGVATQQLVQLAVPDELRGRVLSLFGIIFRAGPGVGALIMGWIADTTGLAWPVGIGAALGLIAYIFANSRQDRLQAALEDAGREAHVTATSASAAKTAETSAERAAE
jgi:MFS family permease